MAASSFQLPASSFPRFRTAGKGTGLLALWPGSLAIAAAAAVVIFGAGHGYQGARGIVHTTTAGGIGMAVYLLTGSLLAPMLLHATLDLANGLAVYRVLRD